MAFCYLVGMLPAAVFNKSGECLGLFLYYCGFRRKIVSENLQLALSREKSGPELSQLTKEIYRHIGSTFLGIARNFAFTRDDFQRELELGEEDDRFLSELKQSGKGAVFLSAHIANWELLAMGMASRGFPVHIVVKKMSNGFSQALVERQRLRTGLGVIYSGRTIEKMKQALIEGKFVGFMVDQNITGTKGIRANFFGVPAASIRGLANMVRDTGAYVIPICAYRAPNGTHKVKLLKPLPFLTAPELQEGSEERYLREEWLNTQQYQTAAEELIRAHPEQWLWIHRRSKASRAPISFETAHRENVREASGPATANKT